MSPRLLVAAAAALLGACGAEDDTQLGVEIGAASMQLDPEPAEVAEEAWLLYEELARRLEERGVTLEELQAAADADDEEAIREMFGRSTQQPMPVSWTWQNERRPPEPVTIHPRSLRWTWRAGIATSPFLPLVIAPRGLLYLCCKLNPRTRRWLSPLGWRSRILLCCGVLSLGFHGARTRNETEMIEVTGIIEGIIILVVGGAAFLALYPYVPTWTWYMLNVLVALGTLMYIVIEGPTQQSVVVFTLAVLMALRTWWRDLRRGVPDRRTVALVTAWAVIGIAAIGLRSHVPYWVTFALAAGFAAVASYFFGKLLVALGQERRSGSDESSGQVRDRRQQGP